MKACFSFDFVVDGDDPDAVVKAKEELEAIEDIVKKYLLKDTNVNRFTGTQVRSIPYNKQWRSHG